MIDKTYSFYQVDIEIIENLAKFWKVCRTDAIRMATKACLNEKVNIKVNKNL